MLIYSECKYVYVSLAIVLSSPLAVPHYDSEPQVLLILRIHYLGI